MKKNIRRTRRFTLVEVIAVLIILGILIAVAVPKYFSLVEESKNRACQGALAEAFSICSLVYAERSLALGAEPTIDAAFTGLVDTELAALSNTGDFTVTRDAAVADGIGISVAGKAGTRVENGLASGTWYLPADPAAP